MFKKLKKVSNKFLFRSAVFIAIASFFVCSNHLVQEHHNGEKFNQLSSSQDQTEERSVECSDGYTYTYNNRNCGSEDIFTNLVPLLFSQFFDIEVKQIFSVKNKPIIITLYSSSIYLSHSVLQV